MSLFGWCLDGKHEGCPGSYIKEHLHTGNKEETITVVACDCRKCNHNTQQTGD